MATNVTFKATSDGSRISRPAADHDSDDTRNKTNPHPLGNTGTTPGTSDAAAGGDEIGERWDGMGDGGAEPGAEVVPE